ncbi:shikimate kinase [Mycetocola reblochoni]|uniref:Shikimate kinase n=2 Tax=Mycetocola reblochoni TaxID=331618 RepID=A0A1R4J3S7_9MICO|nr:shikimate kinase [Mycetocola reblochoni]RLP69506.1 shikimate kinase [Mycetocola reblochoni]SJN26688.1 Shikimate kinase I [Mycetocola reblochoni REB411]
MPRPLAVLIGPMGVGKTRLGKRVAKRLGVPFTDTDKVVVAAHGPITDIFAEHGEDWFRGVESETVLAALEGDGIVSLGGGAVLHPATRAALAGHTVVFLTSPAEAVLARIDLGKRPLLRDDPGAWERIFREREPVYRALASHTVDTSGRPMEHVVDTIVALVAPARDTTTKTATAEPAAEEAP